MGASIARQACRRASLIGAVVVLLSTSVTMGAAAAAPKPPKPSGVCEAKNVTLREKPSPDLQAVIDGARSGDIIRVKGTCTGNYLVSTSLTLQGVASFGLKAQRVQAVLDGGLMGTVLTVAAGDVTVKNLTVTRGFNDELWDDDDQTPPAGGIACYPGASLVLSGATTVTGNTIDGVGANQCAVTVQNSASVAKNLGDGVSLFSATLSLRHTSRIASNTPSVRTWDGYGVSVAYSHVVMHDSSSVADNAKTGISGWHLGVEMNDHSTVSGNSGRTGGGIYTERGGVTMRDSSRVVGNSAHEGGGVFIGWDAMGRLFDNASISGNSATHGGGLATDFMATVTLEGEASITSNTAELGGGIWSFYGGSTTLLGASFVSDNVATVDGGGIWLGSEGSLENGIAGLNVRDNDPNDIVYEPTAEP